MTTRRPVMRRKAHLHLAASTDRPGERHSDLSALIFWKNEARRLRASHREATAQVAALSSDLSILWKAWKVATRGEQEELLRLASGMSESDFLEWLTSLPDS
jgi:hypothetical protein